MENQEKAKLLKITVSSEAEKAIILRNVLKLHVNRKIQKPLKTYTSLTPKEQEANKKF